MCLLALFACMTQTTAEGICTIRTQPLQYLKLHMHCMAIQNELSKPDLDAKTQKLHLPSFVVCKQPKSEKKNHTSHFRLRTSHFSFLTASFTLQTPHFTLHTSHYALRTPNLNFALHTSHFSLPTASFTLHTSHCTLHAPHFTLL